jgi:steroid delta-isomerase
MLNDSLLASTLIALALFAMPAKAVAATDAEADIRAALTQWTKDFNAGDADAACALFAPDLRYDFRGYPERGYDDVCGLVRRSLADKGKTYTYALDIREVIVSGDMAVVRLVWTLTITLPNGQQVTSVEPGLDVFRKDPDGGWRIFRYLAYDLPERGTRN